MAQNGHGLSISRQKLTISSQSISTDQPEVGIKGQTKPAQRSATRIYLLVIAVSLIIILALIIALAVVASRENNTIATDSNICMTEHCVRAASALSESMDRSVKPCDDFYQFACGGWNKKHVIPEDKSMTGVFVVLDEAVQVILKNLLEKGDKSDIESVRKAKDYYKSCVNEDRIENLTVNVAHSLLNDLGGWPVLENKPGGHWNSSDFSIENMLFKIRKYSNSPPIMDMFAYDDFKNPKGRVLYIDQSPKFGMPERSYFLKPRDDKLILAYQTFATKTAELFGASADTAQKDMKEMVDFEIKLANISMPAADRRDEEKLYNPTTIKKLSESYPEFQWLKYFQMAMRQPEINIVVDSSETIIVRNPDYISKVFTIIKNTRPRVVCNYIIWRAVLWLTQALPKSIRELYQHYRNELVGTSSIPPRWKFCTSHVNKRIGLAVGKLFVNEAFDADAKLIAVEMIENLREAMKDLISTTDWMDEPTKTVAREKADVMESRIGYPDEILDNSKINEKYERLHISPSGYFNNVVNYMKFSAIENLEKLRKPVDRSKWEASPATVNAYYNPARNQIIFPAGILQPPIYSAHYPQYLNYGGIGYVIGHEITHGFDDTGRLYDKNGNLNHWWGKSSIENFKRKANCTINQYSAYRVKEANQNINGKLTLGENIADNGGIKEGYMAYRKWVEKHGTEEPKLPGLEFTPNQLFFLSAAHVWCGTVRPKEAVRRILVDPHSHFNYRVIGSLQNSEDFARTFRCPIGSHMNPAKKCQIW